jgi:hypothetical protein
MSKKTVIILSMVAALSATLLFTLGGGKGRRHRAAFHAPSPKKEAGSSRGATFRFLGHRLLLEDEGWMDASILSKKGSLRDPFATPFSSEEPRAPSYEAIKKGAKKAEEARKPIPIELKAIIVGKHEKVAIVGEEVVSVGSKIGKEEVLDIQEDRILVGSEGHRREVLLVKGGSSVSIIEYSSEDLLSGGVIKK